MKNIKINCIKVNILQVAEDGQYGSAAKPLLHQVQPQHLPDGAPAHRQVQRGDVQAGPSLWLQVSHDHREHIFAEKGLISFYLESGRISTTFTIEILCNNIPYLLHSRHI